MKKILALMLFGLSALSGALPADESKGLAGYGLRTAFSLSNVCGRDSESRLKPGFALGAFARYRVSPALIIQAELQYVQKGAVSVGTFFPDYRERFSLDYLELSILAGTTRGSGAWRTHLLAGPALALRLCGSFRAGWDGGSYRHDDLSAYRGFDLGLVLGAGRSYPLGPGRLSVELRATLGLLNIFRAGERSATNQALLLGVGYMLGAKKSCQSPAGVDAHRGVW